MPHYNPNKHHRRSIRLQGYDYSQERLYFITICCQDRAHLFGEIVEKCLQLNDAGIQAQQCWLGIPNHFPNVVLHEFVIMPNHIHGIIEFVGANNYSPNQPSSNQPSSNQPLPDQPLPDQPLPDNFGVNDLEMANGGNLGKGAKDFSPLRRSPSKTIGSVVRGFKIGVTKWMRNNTNVVNVWQRNYYDHIIRNEQDYDRISEYIKNNPAKWENDKFYNR